MEDLEREIKLEYDRTMNGIIFEKVLMSHPKEFSHISLPPKEPEYVPKRGKRVSFAHIYVCFFIIPIILRTKHKFVLSGQDAFPLLLIPRTTESILCFARCSPGQRCSVCYRKYGSSATE